MYRCMAAHSLSKDLIDLHTVVNYCSSLFFEIAIWIILTPFFRCFAHRTSVGRTKKNRQKE